MSHRRQKAIKFLSSWDLMKLSKNYLAKMQLENEESSFWLVFGPYRLRQGLMAVVVFLDASSGALAHMVAGLALVHLLG